jgi:ATP adenylyltransferase
MERLYAPWRSDYTSDTVRSKDPNATTDECIFCEIAADTNDEKNFVLHRGKYNFALLNRYPYNAGHLMVIPYAHTSDVDLLAQEERAEMMEMLAHASTVLKQALKAEAINYGANQGKAAGAGIPSHLHFHVLPRWNGDTNFLPLLSDTKQISFDLNEIYKKLKNAYSF